MAPKPGNLNPDSKAGNARLGTGRGSNAGRSQASGANKAVPTPKKFTAPAGIKVKTTGTVYSDPSVKYPSLKGGTQFTQLPGGRWMGNKAPTKPLTYYTKSTDVSVTNTNTGTTHSFGGRTPEQAIKSFLESEPVYAKLTQGFSAAIKKAK